MIQQEEKIKSKSLHQYITPIDSVIPVNNEKMLSTQNRFFKYKEKIFDKPQTSSTEKMKQEFSNSIISYRAEKKHKGKDSPPRFYESERSDHFRRMKNPACLILKENKFNSHRGLYKSQDLVKREEDLMIPKNKSLIFKQETPKKSLNIEKEIVKELNIQSFLHPTK